MSMALPAFSLLLALAVPLQVPDAGASQPPPTLAAMRDRYRPLLLFSGPPDQQGGVEDQIRSLMFHRADLLDRKVLLVDFYQGGKAERVDPELQVRLSGEEAALRRRFHVDLNGFTVILLGKDGGEKLRSHTPVTIEQLIRIIDAMPMRQQEMRSRHTP